MIILQQLKVALTALWRNKSRSFLTMLGVIIGVSSVILLVAIGDGLRNLVNEQFESFGANNIFVAPGEVFSEGGGLSGQGQINALANNPIEYADVTDIERLREYVQDVSAMSLRAAEITFQDEAVESSVAGVDASYSDITDTTAETGRFFREIEDRRRARVAVLGYAIADDLFGEIDPIGKSIRFNNQSYEVVGVAVEKGGGFGGPAFDEYVYIPIQTWFDAFDSQQIMRMIVKARSEEQIEQTMVAIEATLLERLEDDEFSVFEQTQILSVIDSILGGLTAGLGGIAAISLLVGGIGIMNIMLVSVTERTSEIGLRKALGATPSTILLQFIIEAVLLSVVGGMIGVLLATMAAFGISQFIPAAVTIQAVMLAFGVSAGVGIVFGVYPARQASQLSPIEALRYE